MEKRLHSADVIVLLQTHGFDLLAQVEAAARCVHDVQRQVAILKEQPDEAARADALHAIREDASMLLMDNDGFCSTLREVQSLAAQLSPERRHAHQFVMWDRRRRA
jgi:hypothetical protein